jgi:mannose-6-phosphate isomerase-like protein (cupin superfamily)
MGKQVMIEKPWGNYRILTEGSPVCVKILTIDPHQRLSLQTHERRAEAWFALSDGLEAEVEGIKKPMPAYQRIYVGIGEAHRISNPTDQPIQVIELMFGVYDENDIFRMEDDYAR